MLVQDRDVAEWKLVWTYRTLSRMLSPGEIVQIKMEIERLEKLYKECHEEGMRKRITAWIEEQKQKLV